jgi:4-carboxymuconolactone decarboxylase
MAGRRSHEEKAMQESEGYKAGLAVRRKVLGEKYVDEALAKADDFTRPFQQYVTEHAWGAVWTREGLDLRTRSMLNLAILAAINRPAELRLHVRGALNNGVTKAEMCEIFLQCAVYCGAPAALEAFKVAKEALEDAKGR